MERDLCISLRTCRETNTFMRKDLYVYEKRPIFMKRDVLKIDKYKSKKLHRVGQERKVGQKRFSTMSSSLKNILANVKYVKSDVYTWKETYIHKKRPIQTYMNGKRPVQFSTMRLNPKSSYTIRFFWQERPTSSWKETYVNEKRPIHMWRNPKTSYVIRLFWQKRRIHMNRDKCIRPHRGLRYIRCSLFQQSMRLVMRLFC